MSNFLKYKYRLFSTSPDLGSSPAGLESRVTNLENNEYKVTYYEIISGTSGTITPPTTSTFNSGEFGLSGNAILSKIDGSNKPTFETPLTSSEDTVTVSLNTTTGAYIASGIYTDPSVALIYSITIKAVNWSNLNTFYIIDSNDGNEIVTDYVEFNTNAVVTNTVGRMNWNNTNGTVDIGLKGGSVKLKNGIDLVARVVNKVTPNTTLTKAAYQVVKVTGAQGQRLAVNLAQANNDNNSADTLGIVIETIATNQEGFILCVGQIEDINTTGSLQGETWSDGDVLYLSPTTAGAITKVKPTGATGHIVVLGYVEYAHAIHGKIYVKVMNGWELDELHNVYINNPANNEVLTYESATSLWKNKAISTGLTTGITTIASGTNTNILYNNSGVLGEYSTTGTGTTAVLSTSPTFVTDIKSPLIYGSTSANGNLTLSSTSNATKGTIQIGTTDLVNIGNAVTTNQRLVRIGQDTAYLDIGSLAVGTSNAAIYFNQSAPALANSALWGSSASTSLNVASGGDIGVKFGNVALVTMYGTMTGGNITNFNVTLPTMNTVTASANSPSFKVTGSTKTWAAGALATQYFNYFSANTVAFASASTITNSYGLFVEAATAGTNATISNNYGIGTNGNAYFGVGTTTNGIRLEGVVGNTGNAAIFLNNIPSTTNHTLAKIGSTTVLNCDNGGNTEFRHNNVSAGSVSWNSWSLTPLAVAFGSYIPFQITFPADTGRTSATEIPNFYLLGNNKQWATGNITTQRWNYFTANTASFVGASTITNSYGLYVEAATAGTNATITNNYAAGFGGNILINTGTTNIITGEVTAGNTGLWMNVVPSSTNYFIQHTGSIGIFNAPSQLQFRVNNNSIAFSCTNTQVNFAANIAPAENVHFILGTSGGSKIGTSTSQKLGFWNATPIVQPTTAVTAATLVSNAGTALTSTDTFDGYTLQQVVKALRNTGLLA